MKIVGKKNVPTDVDNDHVVAYGMSERNARVIANTLNAIDSPYYYEALPNTAIIKDSNDAYGFPYEKRISHIHEGIVHFANGATTTVDLLEVSAPERYTNFLANARTFLVATTAQVILQED